MAFDPEQHFETTPLEPVLDLARKTVLVATTWNRKNTVNICLRQTVTYKLGAALWIYDDGSDEYDESFLLDIADRVYRQEHGCGGREGVKKLRSFIMKSILLEGYEQHDVWAKEDFPDGIEYVYHVDSDVIHDPWFFHRIYELTQQFPDYGAVCLYNPKFRPSSKKCKLNPRTFPNIHTVRRQTGYGCSLFFPLQKFRNRPDYIDIPEGGEGWDLFYSRNIALGNVVTSATSYVEHFGGGGMHNNEEYQKSRAKNPTLYLTETRSRVVSALSSTKYYGD